MEDGKDEVRSFFVIESKTVNSFYTDTGTIETSMTSSSRTKATLRRYLDSSDSHSWIKVRLESS